MTTTQPADLLVHVALSDAPLSVDAALAAVAHPAAGGLALFVGTVRDEDGGRTVTALEYLAHPGAQAALHEVVAAVAAAHPVRGIAAVHRVGELSVGDLAVVVAVSCPHRGEAFAACRQLIDDLKHTVPIWKRQTYTDGTSDWVGCA